MQLPLLFSAPNPALSSPVAAIKSTFDHLRAIVTEGSAIMRRAGDGPVVRGKH